MKNYALLLLTAAIWGFAFVAQRKGNEVVDPFVFNALRFALGAFCVWLIKALVERDKSSASSRHVNPGAPVLLGLILFVAASLQQVGMLWTNAGSAGFITGLYVVFIPIIGIVLGAKSPFATWIAVLLAAGGLWMINSGASLEATLGNALVLLSSVFWAIHVIMVGRITKHHKSLSLAVIQYSVCACLSLLAGLVFAWFRVPGFGPRIALIPDIRNALGPILYGGILSVGIAYTLQLHAQKKVRAHLAGIIMCMEAVFAMLGGMLLLDERYSFVAYLGAALVLGSMLTGVLVERGEAG